MRIPSFHQLTTVAAPAPPVPEKPKARQFLRATVWLAVFAGLMAIALLLPQCLESKPQLQEVAAAGQRMINGGALYSGSHHFDGSPLIALAGSLIDFTPTLLEKSFYVLSLAAVWCSLFCIAQVRRLILSGASISCAKTVVFWIALICCSAAFLVVPLVQTRLELVMLVLVTLVITYGCRWRELRAGAFAGVAAAWCAAPILFLLQFLWQFRGFALLSMTVTLALAIILPELIHPAGDEGLWIEQFFRTSMMQHSMGGISTSSSESDAWNINNQSLMGTLHRLVTPPSDPQQPDVQIVQSFLQPAGMKVLISILQLALLAWLWFASRPSLTKALDDSEFALRRLGEGASLAAVVLLAAPFSQPAQFCLMLLPVAFCVAYVVHIKRDWFVMVMIVIMAGSGLVSLPAGIGMQCEGGERSAHLLALGSLTAGALAGLLGCSRILLRRTIDIGEPQPAARSPKR